MKVPARLATIWKLVWGGPAAEPTQWSCQQDLGLHGLPSLPSVPSRWMTAQSLTAGLSLSTRAKQMPSKIGAGSFFHPGHLEETACHCGHRLVMMGTSALSLKGRMSPQDTNSHLVYWKSWDIWSEVVWASFEGTNVEVQWGTGVARNPERTRIAQRGCWERHTSKAKFMFTIPS